MGVRVFVGNLPYDTTDSELREHFAPAGNIVTVFLPVDRDTGRPRGFAFVEFADAGGAEEAIRRFNAQSFKGRPLAVNEARARESRPAGSFTPSAPPSAWSGAPSGDSARPAPARRFGPDAKPSRGRSRGPKQERKAKGPIRERGGGRIFDADGGDDWRQDEEEILEDDLASSPASDSDDGD